MTTIACNLEEMAADSRITQEDHANKRINVSYATKIERIEDTIVGSSGDYQAGVRFHDWLKSGGRKPRLCKEFRALKLTKDGIFLMDGDDLTWMPLRQNFSAIGSGCGFAIGAMVKGASPKEAVSIAKDWDVYSGGPVTVIQLEKS